MADIKYEFLTLENLDDDEYEEIPCTDINHFEFISLKQHFAESGIDS